MKNIINIRLENQSYAQILQQSPVFNINMISFKPKLFHLVNSDRYMSKTPMSHNTLEFSLIEEGCIEYYINNDHIRLVKGDVIMIPPRILHTWKVIETPFIITGFQISMSPNENGSDLLDRFYEYITHGNFHLKDFIYFQSVMSDIRNELHSKHIYFLDKISNLIYSLLIELMHKLSLPLDKSTGNFENKYSKHIELIKGFVEANLSVPLVLADIADYLNMSTRQLTRIFKNEEGISLGEYILIRKIAMGKNRLEDSDDSVKIIAIDLGFEVNYFCRIFKQRTHKTPSEYRDMCKHG